MSTRFLTLLNTLEYPPEWKSSDRHLFTLYCNFHNDEKRKAFPPNHVLTNITGLADKSVSRSRKKLIACGALIRITRAYPGRQAEHAVSEQWLLANQQVTPTLPIIEKGLPASAKQVTGEVITGNLQSLNGLPPSYPKRINEINETNEVSGSVSIERFDYLIRSSLPKHLAERINPGADLNKLIDELHAKGVPDAQIKKALENHDWGGITGSGYMQVINVLSKLLHVKVVSKRAPEPFEADDGTERHTATPEQLQAIKDIFRKVE